MKGVKETEVYKTENDDIYVRFRLAHWLFGSYTYYVHHTFPWRRWGWGAWKLDESRVSDFAAAVGFWRVLPVAGQREKSDVIYSADLRFKSKTSRFIRNVMVKRGLRQASSWVKKQSERR